MPITAVLCQAIGNMETDSSPLHRQSDCVNALTIEHKSERERGIESNALNTETDVACSLLFVP